MYRIRYLVDTDIIINYLIGKNVGLPLAKAFSKHLKVIGFDIDEEKTKNLGNNKNDKGDNIEFTADPSKIKRADFVMVAVPTPVTKSNLI